MTNASRKSTYWVMATLTIAMAPQLVRMPAPLVLITLLPLLWRTGAEIRGWKPLPSLIRHGVTALALLTLFFSYGNLTGRRAAVSLLTVMLSLKLIECYRIRDARLLTSFSVFLCATQFLFAQGILMPIYGGIAIVFTLISLAQLQRNEAFRQTVEPPAIAASILSEMGFSVRLLLLAAPVGLAFFMFFPRLSVPLWGIPETALDSKSGLSDSMSPGSIQNLFMDDSPAFRVEFESEIPSAADLYWRGPVFWNYDGKTWSGGFFGKNIKAKSQPVAEGAPWRYQVQLEPNERNWLFSLDYPANVPNDAQVTMDFQILHRQPITQLLQYALVSNPDFIDTPDLAVTLRTSALDLPEKLNPRTRELVREWQSQGLNGRALAQRVLTYFNQEEFHYSLESPLLGKHSIDEFMFETRTGYCEHYASAFSVMMRMAGIPARIVTGYQGGWYNEMGNYLLVRQSDAHAWSELWFPGTGWTRVDPTAAVSPARVASGSLGALSAPRHLFDFPWLRGARNGLDIVQQRWNDWVIEFGATQQAEMLSSLGLKRMSPVILVILLFTAIGLCSIILVPILLKIKGPGQKDPLQLAWHLFLARLKSAGFEAKASSGAMELAQAAATHLPDHAQPIHRIAGLYSRYRYSAVRPALQDFKQAVSEFHPKKS